MSETYSDFFCRVTGNPPLPYQERYAADPFSPTLMIVPTGLGKTDAVLMPWLYARATGARAPTRLIVVLPRQNLTAQTAGNARERVHAAKIGIRVLELMGGSADNDESVQPHEPVIIVSTQDLYFSRALNRGYARRPPRWPVDFALYNQNCLIVLDEVQLMDDALATSTQLAAFRERFGTFGPSPCVWMSATVNPAWLRTVDFAATPRVIRLEPDDRKAELVRRRIHASKSLAAALESCSEPRGCAEFALERHRPGTRTLVIANTVGRAREIFASIHKQFGNTVLLHSRFRPVDRKHSGERLRAPIPCEGQIVVATQVVEAGVDITSRLMVTDIAPWGSMVQRFGRVNRYGDDAEAEIWWVDNPATPKQKSSWAPYEEYQISDARERLKRLQSAAPADLPDEDGSEPYKHVLRKADLLDLFDTTPDLSGNELDVSRFIRATEDKDVYLAWRNWPGDQGPADTPRLGDEELCAVPIGDFREFAKKHDVYALSFAADEWVRIDSDTPIYPGMLAVARSSEGGYTETEGWSPGSKAAVTDLSAGDEEDDTDTADRRSFPKYRQTLRAHTDRVRLKMDETIAQEPLDGEPADALRLAALLHDWGKGHEVFQRTMHRTDSSPDLLAKQCGRGRHERKHFRHELASALAMLQTGESDLAAYLAAAHHGRVRLGIRSMPGEREENGVRVARGIRESDHLDAFEIGSGVSVPAIELSLEVMEFGALAGSWTERILALRDRFGPFRLAYLEALLRSADEMASADPGLEMNECPRSN